MSENVIKTYNVPKYRLPTDKNSKEFRKDFTNVNKS